jgi:ATP-dependent DNA helicase RecQ
MDNHMNATYDLVSSLQKHFSFTGFRPGQAEATQSLLNGQHTLVVMPTGSGKSLVFQLAGLLLPGLTLVISPLIALMKDQVDSLERRGIPAAYINSTLSGSEQNQRLKRLAAGEYKIVYTAPERLRSTQFLNTVKKQAVSLLAVDEAHCISEWGHDFRPDYLHIAQFRTAVGAPLTAALTATATPQVQDDIASQLNLPAVQRVVTGFNRPNLTLQVHYTSDLTSRLRALQELLADHRDGAAIIYTGTRRDAEEVAEFVTTVVGIKAQYYHAGLLPEHRTRIQDAFMAGDLSVIAATNAFGMGIDRPDVRQVIHYSLPGSLEAYYQEAGRAGRDEIPARAVLLYSPENRALQEWFIADSAVSRDDLRMLFDMLRPASDAQETTTVNELSRLAGLSEVKVRLGLAELERAGIINHLGDEGLRMRMKVNEWDAAPIKSATERIKKHQDHRKSQLERMIAYAETNDCRRTIILKHFGDTGPVEAEVCCDNCQARQTTAAPANEAEAHTQAARVPLVVLDTVRRLGQRVGREKIAQLLKGSQAQDILKFGYNKSIYYGRLAVFTQAEIKEIIGQLCKTGYLKVIGSEYPVLHLTPQGEAALKTKSAIPIKLPRKISARTVDYKRAERVAGGTLEYTAQLLSQGLTVEQIAAQRGLSPGTIYSHAAKLITAGRVQVESVVPETILNKIEAAIQKVGAVEYLYPIKMALPDEIGYDVIRCAVEGWKLRQGQPADQPPQATPEPPPAPGEDAVAAFLSRSHPRQLPGPWNAGWALGFHSAYAGATWNRSATGELTYRLKYQGDLSVLPALVEQAVALIAEHPELAQVDAILPVPPSTPRPNDPVSSFAKALAHKLGLAYLPVLVKARQTTPQKEMHTLAQNQANVAAAFNLKSPLKGKRILVIDDLFDSGTTLTEIDRLLRRAGAITVCVLTLTRTIHSDA